MNVGTVRAHSRKLVAEENSWGLTSVKTQEAADYGPEDYGINPVDPRVTISVKAN